MIPETDSMILVAKRLEQVSHREGWDSPPCLGLAFDAGNTYRTLPFPVQPQDLTDDVLAGLLFIADKIFESDVRFREALNQDANLIEATAALAAVWFVSEGWASSTPPEQWEEGKGPADIVGSKEVRFVVMIDCGGTMYHVHRIRGEKPRAIVVTPGDSDADGNVVEALCRILLGLGAAMPDGAVDMEAISALTGRSPLT